MIYAILSVLLVGSLYGNYYLYSKLKLASAAIKTLTGNLAALLTPKAAETPAPVATVTTEVK